jgi:hypothetical protein
MLMGEDEFNKLDVETLTEHVTMAALAMIEKVKQQSPSAAAGEREGTLS